MDKLSWLLLIITLSLFALYTPLNVPRGEIFSFRTVIDEYIPLWTPFLIIYVSYYVLLVFTYTYLVGRRKFELLKVTLAAAIICYLTAYLFYWFFQNGVDRPIIENSNIFDVTYTWINSWLAPFNAFPSLHVATSVICAISFYKAKSTIFKQVLVWALLICSATVLTKQHYFLDVPAGMILGGISFGLAEYFLKGKIKI